MEAKTLADECQEVVKAAWAIHHENRVSTTLAECLRLATELHKHREGLREYRIAMNRAFPRKVVEYMPAGEQPSPLNFAMQMAADGPAGQCCGGPEGVQGVDGGS